MRQLNIDPATVMLPPHVIDLSANGSIQPHVDSIKFSGGFVVGLSLVSKRILQLVHTPDKHTIETVLEPRSLYMLSHRLRYDYEHAILGTNDKSLFFEPFDCSQRLSVMMRDAHPDDAQLLKR